MLELFTSIKQGWAGKNVFHREVLSPQYYLLFYSGCQKFVNSAKMQGLWSVDVQRSIFDDLKLENMLRC